MMLVSGTLSTREHQIIRDSEISDQFTLTFRVEWRCLHVIDVTGMTERERNGEALQEDDVLTEMWRIVCNRHNNKENYAL